MINIETLNRYKEQGLLRSQSHPTRPLTIWNYTEKVQFERLWDEVTLKCRGLITDDETGEVIVYPMEKFFNYEEVKDKGMIPTKPDYVYVQDKMDGSLGILFNYKGEWIMATRGSFTSEQAVKGLEIAKKQCFLKSFYQEYVYFVEIIYPENRIVVDYDGEEKIVFLSVGLNLTFNWQNKTFNPTELHWTTAKSIFYSLNIDKKYIVKTNQIFAADYSSLYKTLKSENIPNSEGFVLRFQPDNFRMKIKFEDYIRLHKIMTEVSTTSIWEVLSNGGDLGSHLEGVPDEYYDKIRDYELTLKMHYNMIYATVLYEYDKVVDELGELVDQKTFALHIKDNPWKSYLFKIRKGMSVDDMIWKEIKPKYRRL